MELSSVLFGKTPKPNPTYYEFRRRSFAGPIKGEDSIIQCARKSASGIECCGCCDSAFPVTGSVLNIRRRKRCKFNCELMFGANVCSGTTPSANPPPASGATCGIVCTSGGSGVTGPYGQCHYDCDVPPSTIPNPGGGPIPLQSSNIISTGGGTYPTSYSAPSGNGAGGFISEHPLLVLGVAGAAVFLFSRMGKS